MNAPLPTFAEMAALLVEALESEDAPKPVAESCTRMRVVKATRPVQKKRAG